MARNDRELNDLGVTRYDVHAETRKPFWRAWQRSRAMSMNGLSPRLDQVAASYSSILLCEVLASRLSR